MLKHIRRCVLGSEVIGLWLLLGKTLTCSFYLLLAYTLRPSVLVHFRKPSKASWMTTKIPDELSASCKLNSNEFKDRRVIAWSQTWLYASLPFRQRACNVVSTDRLIWLKDVESLSQDEDLSSENFRHGFQDLINIWVIWAYMDLTEYTYNSMKRCHQFQPLTAGTFPCTPAMYVRYKKVLYTASSTKFHSLYMSIYIYICIYIYYISMYR